MIDGATSQPFSAITLPPQLMTDSQKDNVIELCRGKYGREREVVEKSIFEQYRKSVENKKEPGLFG